MLYWISPPCRVTPTRSVVPSAVGEPRVKGANSPAGESLEQCPDPMRNGSSEVDSDTDGRRGKQGSAGGLLAISRREEHHPETGRCGGSLRGSWETAQPALRHRVPICCSVVSEINALMQASANVRPPVKWVAARNRTLLQIHPKVPAIHPSDPAAIVGQIEGTRHRKSAQADPVRIKTGKMVHSTRATS